MRLAFLHNLGRLFGRKELNDTLFEEIAGNALLRGGRTQGSHQIRFLGLGRRPFRRGRARGFGRAIEEGLEKTVIRHTEGFLRGRPGAGARAGLELRGHGRISGNVVEKLQTASKVNILVLFLNAYYWLL